MLTKKLEALEGRLVKMMAKDETAKSRFEPAYKFIKAALDAANEGNHHTALENVSRFNTLMLEYKTLRNV